MTKIPVRKNACVSANARHIGILAHKQIDNSDKDRHSHMAFVHFLRVDGNAVSSPYTSVSVKFRSLWIMAVNSARVALPSGSNLLFGLPLITSAI